MLIGYVRYVPTAAPETDQIRMMVEKQAAKIFTEQTGSGSAELKARQDLLDFVREGDVVLADSIHIIARNIGELLDVLRRLEEKGVTFVSEKDGIDTGNENGRFLLRILKSMSTLDMDAIVAQRRESDAEKYAAAAARPAQPKAPAQPVAPSRPAQPAQPVTLAKAPAQPAPAPKPQPQPQPQEKPTPAPKPQPQEKPAPQPPADASGSEA